MATPPSQIRIAELDYDQILANLVEFMKADPTFSDYDFSGSGLRLLSRVLAYVTFYNSYYLSAAVNEAFLDTAQLRSSVVSHAKMLGYQSHGTRSATYDANVTMVMTDTSPATVTLPKNTQLVLQSNSQVTFYVSDDVELRQNTANANVYFTSNVTLVEGRPAQYRFTVNLNDPTQRFIIPNANVDFSRISVRVQISATVNTYTSFTELTDILIANSTSPVFIVSEAYDGYPELKFGNDVIGKALEQGNIIIADYYISSGEAGNGVRGPFSINSTITSMYRGVTATPDANTMPSMGGSAAENIEDIRYLAPLTYAAQNRCVTAEDYKSLILQDWSQYVSAINVFGGEEGDPNDALERPTYGRVYIAICPKLGNRLTEAIKNSIIENTIKPFSIVGVIPQVIDPDYIYLLIRTRVSYDPRATIRSKQQLVSAVQDAIDTYSNENMEKFDTSFRFSRLGQAIDAADPSISSSLTQVTLQKRVVPVVGKSNVLTVKFGTALYREGNSSILLEPTSHRFDYYDHDGTYYTNCFLKESNGVVDVVGYVVSGGTRTLVTIDDRVGAIDANTGTMTLANFKPEAIENDEVDIWISALPQYSDLTPQLNRLYTVDYDTISVELYDDTTKLNPSNFYQGGRLR
jgi:hypothetical protein